jgi:hypothetical protein
MKFYIHFGHDILINDCAKSDNRSCAVGPFETKEEAQAWVDAHACAYSQIFKLDTATATDPRKGVEK